MKKETKLRAAVLLTILTVGGSLALMSGTPPPTEKTVDVIVTPIVPVIKEAPPAKRIVKNIKVEADQLLFLDAEINTDSIDSTLTLLSEMTKTHDDVYLLIDSPGGSVMAGARLIAFMESSPKRIHTVCIGLCASMAAHIFESGKTRLITDNATIMFHPASGESRGQVENMQSRINMIKAYVDKFDMKVCNRSGYDYNKFKARVAFEYWVASEEALSTRLADGLVFITSKDSSNLFGTKISSLRGVMFDEDIADPALDFTWK